MSEKTFNDERPDCELCHHAFIYYDDRYVGCNLGLPGPADECLNYSHFLEGEDETD